MPILRECIQDTNAYSRVSGCQALWDLTRDSETTVPVLKGVIEDTNLGAFHLWSIGLLSRWGPELETRCRCWNLAPTGTEMFSEQIQETARDALERISKAE